MGIYNPHFPHIIGEEWVPIRNENLQFSPSVSAVEIGYQFDHFNSSDFVTNARYYLNKWAERIESTVVSTFITQSFFAALYEAGTEDETGPIQVIRVPVMGGASGGGGGPSLVNSTSVQQALATPNDGRYIFITATTLGPIFQILDLYFSVRSFDELLWNKRIVAIDVVYNAAVTFNSEPNSTFLGVGVGTSIDYGQATFNELGVMHIGDTNWFFATDHAGLVSPTPHPFTPTSVRRFDQNAGSPIRVRFQANSDADFVENQTFELHYVAMDIYYCEERRIAMGGGVHSLQGMNQTTLYTPTEPASGGLTLDNKRYTLTLAAADTGDARGLTGTGSILAQPYPSLNATRQLYENPFHPGIQINHPAPVSPNIVGKTFTKESTDVLLQLTLHKGTGSPDVIGDVHAYGRQVAAQVYGSAIAEQTIEDSNIGSVTTQQVRYYARRFGNTSTRLDLVRTSAPTDVIASLTPAEWDDLDPENGIIDGWKEVTLALDISQTFTGTRPTFRWQTSSLAESAGDRWEILAMIAPAISGTVTNQYTPAPASYQLGTATYGWPVSGASDALRWLQVPLSQGVSAVPAVVDPTADAVLMFAVSPPAVTGISLSEQSQALNAVISECVDCDACVPTSLQYNKISWSMGVADTFTRTVASGGWGTADTGDAWTVQSGTAADLSVNGSNGLVAATAGTTYVWTQPDTFTDVENVVTLHTTVPVSGAAMTASLVTRFTDTSNFYYGRATLLTSGLVNLAITKIVAGVTTDLTSFSNIMHMGPDTNLRLKFSVIGTMLTLTGERLNTDGDVVETTVIHALDSSLTAGSTGLRLNVPATTVPLTIYFDDYCAYPGALSGGFYELQRMDSLTDWQTIMRGSPCSWYMNDYESRVGLSSTYRMRIVDVLNFAGPWSGEFSHTLTSPGVSGGPCVDGVGVLIFTSNAAQDGRYNLAYVQTWDGGVAEDFAFPEASTVSLNRVYQRDFAVAFKGTERGGEQFSRSILVSNAAVAPERLANMSSLRDMAWADVPYVCVRDEIGDRWLALVQVPAESVRRNRQLYLAALAITEVTNTAYPIDPVVNV